MKCFGTLGYTASHPKKTLAAVNNAQPFERRRSFAAFHMLYF